MHFNIALSSQISNSLRAWKILSIVLLARNMIGNFKFVDVDALKLTPVQQLTQRIDLSNEAQSSFIAVNSAVKKKQQILQFVIVDDEYQQNDRSLEPYFRDVLESAEFQKLHSTIKRWSLIEDKLRHAISIENHTQVFWLLSYILLLLTPFT